nr:MFS transporter [Legionella impletisoli]
MQFFLQLSSGIVIGAIMRDLHLSALMAGFLASSIYFVYTSFQIPVGILFDRKNTRVLLTINSLLCGIGCLVFASSSTLLGLFTGRILIGAGSAFAFVGYSHILREHIPLKHFAFLLGFSETLAFLVTVAGMISMGELLAVWGWRNFIYAVGSAGFIISFLCWHYIPDSPKPSGPMPHYGRQLLRILKNPRAWTNGLFVGLSFTIVTVFGALWAIPFLQVKLNINLATASLLGAMFFLGAGVSCPLFGYLSVKFARKPLILASCLSTASLLLFTLFAPIQSHFTMGILMFAIGSACGAYMLAFSIANELAPKNSLSTCTGFTNTLAMLTAPIFQTLIGYFLDKLSEDKVYSLWNYQIALSIIPIALALASFLVIWLPEKKS